MKQVRGTVNGTEVTLYAVEQGERVSQVRRDAGLGSEVSVIYIGGVNADVDDAADYRHSFPNTADLLEASGVDLNKVIAVIEEQ